MQSNTRRRAATCGLTLAKGERQITIRVKDTGVGIRPEMLEKVFDLFVQANETLDRAEGGMGVGLTLVRTIAEMHGGSVKAFSDGPEQGQRVCGSPATQANKPTTETDRPPRGSSQPTVLIVEDNADSRRMLEAMLKLDGYTVHTAADGKEGLDAILKLRPTLRSSISACPASTATRSRNRSCARIAQGTKFS